MKIKEIFCPETAEMPGTFIGDGWIQTPGTALYIAGNPVEDKEYYDKFLPPHTDIYERKAFLAAIEADRAIKVKH